MREMRLDVGDLKVSAGAGRRWEGSTTQGCALFSCPWPPGDIPGDFAASARARRNCLVVCAMARREPGAGEEDPCRGTTFPPDRSYDPTPSTGRKDGVPMPTELPWVDCGPVVLKDSPANWLLRLAGTFIGR